MTTETDQNKFLQLAIGVADAMKHPLLSIILLAAMLTGCSTFRPWQNAAAPEVRAPVTAPPGDGPEDTNRRSIVAALTLSGGGARAAAFGLGVMHELKATRFNWEGKETTLLDEIGLISGVSGGSILATHYAMFGDETLSRFEPDFLLKNFEGDFIRAALSPSRFRELTSPWYGLSNSLEEHLNMLYHGQTFGDLASRKRGPRLLVTATDLTTGAPFEFTREQFALICSDLNSVPLSFAVAASSAVPLVLSPITLRNHAGSCPHQPLIIPGGTKSTVTNYRSRMMKASTESYIDARERPFLHLVDGGLADNLGIKGLLDRVVTTGSLQDSFRDRPPGSIRKLVLIVVNSERDLAERIDKSDRVPTLAQAMEALLFGAGSRATQMTLAMLEDDVLRWNEELKRQRGASDSPFAPDAEIHVISVTLRDVPNTERRRLVLRVPTAFTIDPSDVQLLRDSAREALRRLPEFQRLSQSLGASRQQSHQPNFGILDAPQYAQPDTQQSVPALPGRPLGIESAAD